MTEQDSLKSVELPVEIMTRVEKRVQYTEFESEVEYISYILREILDDVEESHPLEGEAPANEDEVKNRLKSLGYLNH